MRHRAAAPLEVPATQIRLRHRTLDQHGIARRLEVLAGRPDSQRHQVSLATLLLQNPQDGKATSRPGRLRVLSAKIARNVLSQRSQYRLRTGPIPTIVAEYAA